jgi:transcriptional regulator with XRE-family HTH domain
MWSPEERQRSALAVRTARQALGMTQAVFGKAIGLGKNAARTVRRYEAAETRPSGPVLQNIKHLLGEEHDRERSQGAGAVCADS